jgi:hypothetical protein
MESVKIFLLMTIISAIAALSHRSDRRASAQAADDRSADAAPV